MPSRRRVEAAEKRVRGAVVILERLLEPSETRGRSVLSEMMRRAEQPIGVTGLPTSSGGERVSGGDGSTDPVFGAVMAMQAEVCGRCDRGMVNGRPCRRCDGTGRRWADPVGESVTRLLEQLVVIASAATLVDREREVVVASARAYVGRQNLASSCDDCARPVSGANEDRLKRGLCPTCYHAFWEWKQANPLLDGDPAAHRMRFITWHQAKRSAEREAAGVAEIDRLRSRGELPAAQAVG